MPGLTVSPATSPPAAGATVAFLASIDFNGQTVPINTGDITQGINNLVFSLSSPVEIGSINNFLDYLNNKLQVPLTSAELQGYINEIPSTPAFLEDFKTTVEKVLSTPLVITVLNVNVGAGTFMLGVSFPIDLELTSFLTLNSVGVVVSRGETTTSP